MESPLACILIFGLISILLTAYRLYAPSLGADLPGPRGLPFLGALFQLPKNQEWLTYAQWGKRYGSIVGFKVLGQNIVVLNTPEAANELLESRAALYSDRPTFPMLELMGYLDWNLGLMPYEKCRLGRRLLHQAMSPKELPAYSHIQEREIHKLLGDLRDSPGEVMKHVHRAAGAIILTVLYGREVGRDEAFIRLNEDALRAASRAAVPTAYFVNMFPMLKYIPAWCPGAGFQQDAIAGKILGDKLYRSPLEMAKRCQENGSVSFVSSVLSNADDGACIDAGCAVAGTSYSAGTETTASTLGTFVLAMALNPAVQKRAQAEIDDVVGLHRLPGLAEKNVLELPYLEAIIKETHRWNPPGNLGVPHCPIEDDVINGYLVPKGAIVLSNVWGILHDETRYSQPFEFIPERYLGKNGLDDPRTHIFGYGKRACPGRRLAEASVWLAVVSILAVFNITPDVDGDGKEIPILVEYTSGIMNRPKDFKCRITPRSDAAAKVISQCQGA